MQQILSLTDGPEVTLDQMLQTRDLRARNQRQWLVTHNMPLISLTLVVPGSIKYSSGAQYLFNTALHHIENTCHTHNFLISAKQDFSTVCGYEALLSVQADAAQLKAICIELEEKHPLGRLWDIDIICPHKGIISRQTTEFTARPCLVCEEDAHACARSRKHSLLELIQVIEEKINAFQCCPK
ncbi:citrate lyase holo-[acyl-carrier protein] synthase [Gammaproteobacteria bacterium ESL0073]|nr:citrate lyase holo-[acyl-carrier protein] synthase [Gammaproteobacteria bacterium ESL0073]